jgi:hypothetical protein
VTEAGRWRNMDNREIHNLYSSLNVTMAISIRRMGKAGHVKRMADTTNLKRNTISET